MNNSAAGTASKGQRLSPLWREVKGNAADEKKPMALQPPAQPTPPTRRRNLEQQEPHQPARHPRAGLKNTTIKNIDVLRTQKTQREQPTRVAKVIWNYSQGKVKGGGYQQRQLSAKSEVSQKVF